MRCPDRGRASRTIPASPSTAARPPSIFPAADPSSSPTCPAPIRSPRARARSRLPLNRCSGAARAGPDAILVVADATALARALYLTLEILEIGHPVVIALNMTDEARRDGITIDAARLEQLTGARVVPTVASKGIGTDAVLTALTDAIQAKDRTSAARSHPVTGAAGRRGRARGADPFRAPHGPAARCPGMGAVAAAVTGSRRRRRAQRHSALGPCRRQSHPSASHRNRPQHRPRDHQRTLSTRRSPDGRSVPARHIHFEELDRPRRCSADPPRRRRTGVRRRDDAGVPGALQLVRTRHRGDRNRRGRRAVVGGTASCLRGPSPVSSWTASSPASATSWSSCRRLRCCSCSSGCSRISATCRAPPS